MLKKIKDYIIKNIKWIILFVCVLAFLEIAEDVFEEEIMSADIIGYNFISKYFITDFNTHIAKFITHFGGAIVLLSVTILSLVLIKDKRIGISITLNLGISVTLNTVLKHILQRPRPEGYRIIDASGYSFPSGHSMVSMAFYGLIIYFIIKYIKNKYAKVSLSVLLGTLIVLIGTSRIYLGVHYTSDVIAGFLVAISYLVVYITAINRFMFDKEAKPKEEISNKEETVNE